MAKDQGDKLRQWEFILETVYDALMMRAGGSAKGVMM